MTDPRAVIKELHAGYHARDAERMRACWHDDAYFLSPTDGFRIDGADQIVEHTVRDLFGPFPDIHTTVHDEVVKGNEVILEVSTNATHTGRGFGRPTEAGGMKELEPTGRNFTGHALDWFTVVDGLIVADRIWFDRLEMLTQLGIAFEDVAA
jgi:ketosteroid isomerase-like protein